MITLPSYKTTQHVPNKVNNTNMQFNPGWIHVCLCAYTITGTVAHHYTS